LVDGSSKPLNDPNAPFSHLAEALTQFTIVRHGNTIEGDSVDEFLQVHAVEGVLVKRITASS
jgi:hypothetical protein